MGFTFGEDCLNKIIFIVYTYHSFCFFPWVFLVFPLAFRLPNDEDDGFPVADFKP